MAISIGIVTQYKPASLSNNWTFSHTVQDDTSILIVTCGTQGDGAVGSIPTGVTWNGTALTEAKTAKGTTYSATAIWYLINPTPGIANIVITYGANNYGGCGAINVFGVDADTPFTVTGNSVDQSSNNPGLTLAVQTHELEIVSVGHRRDNTAYSSSINNGTEIVDIGMGGSVGAQNLVGYRAGSGSLSINWTLSGSTNWDSCGIVLLPALAGLTGVATINGIANANIKTINGIAIADVKSVQGLTFAGDWLRKLDIIRKGGLWIPRNNGLVTI